MNFHAGVRNWGVDRDDANRPGVPMEHAPRPVANAHWTIPESQSVGSPSVFDEADFDRVPPVFGTVQPPHGLSGLIRRAAYGIPEHKVRRWLLLLLADRVDINEHRLLRWGPWMAVLLPAVGLAALTARARRTSRFRRALPW